MEKNKYHGEGIEGSMLRVRHTKKLKEGFFIFDKKNIFVYLKSSKVFKMAAKWNANVGELEDFVFFLEFIMKYD